MGSRGRDSTQQPLPSGRLVDIDHVDVHPGRQQPGWLACLYPQRKQQPPLAGWISSERRPPLRFAEPRAEVGRREHRDRPRRVAGGILHLVNEVTSRPEVPGLQQRRVASAVQGDRNPLRPGLICGRVADEEVARRIVAHRVPQNTGPPATRIAPVIHGPAS
jgi:hypothetical protein